VLAPGCGTGGADADAGGLADGTVAPPAAAPAHVARGGDPPPEPRRAIPEAWSDPNEARFKMDLEGIRVAVLV
jgi:hypothetical protein